MKSDVRAPRGAPRRFTDDQLMQVYRDDLTLRELADLLHAGPQTVATRLKGLGIIVERYKGRCAECGRQIARWNKTGFCRICQINGVPMRLRHQTPAGGS